MTKSIEKLTIKNSAGLDIAAVVHSAKNAKGLAILCPGWMDTKDYPHLVQLAEELSSAGYDAVRFDPTGTWKSGGELADHTPTQCLADIKSVIDYMEAQRKYPRVILCGHSRGGALSVFYATHDPRISFVAAMMSRATSDRPDEGWKSTGFRTTTRDLPDADQGSIKFNVPYSYKEDLDRYNIAEAASRLKSASLFIAGEKDDKIFPESVREFCDKAGGSKSLAIIPGAVHDYRRHPGSIALVNAKVLEAVRKLG